MGRFLKSDSSLSRILSRFHLRMQISSCRHAPCHSPEKAHFTGHCLGQHPLRKEWDYFGAIIQRGICPNLSVIFYDYLLLKFCFIRRKKGSIFITCHYSEQRKLNSKSKYLPGSYREDQKMLLRHPSLRGHI